MSDTPPYYQLNTIERYGLPKEVGRYIVRHKNGTVMETDFDSSISGCKDWFLEQVIYWLSPISPLSVQVERAAEEIYLKHFEKFPSIKKADDDFGELVFWGELKKVIVTMLNETICIPSVQVNRSAKEIWNKNWGVLNRNEERELLLSTNEQIAIEKSHEEYASQFRVPLSELNSPSGKWEIIPRL